MTKMFEYDGVNFSQEHLDVLENAVINRESPVVRLHHAMQVYSSKDAAKNAMQSLQGKGVLERKNEGKWLITNLPEQLHRDWIE